jgi:hypothetical protein
MSTVIFGLVGLAVAVTAAGLFLSGYEFWKGTVSGVVPLAYVAAGVLFSLVALFQFVRAETVWPALAAAGFELLLSFLSFGSDRHRTAPSTRRHGG